MARTLLSAMTLVLVTVASASADPATCAPFRRAFLSMGDTPIRVVAGGRDLTFTARLADTPERQAAGFQCASPGEIQRTLILFDFGREIHTHFHMQNVAAPLDIAFIKADGRIFSIQTMRPGPELHGPLGPFRWALEAPAGFFVKHGIAQGMARLVSRR
jgi:uncharacterized membrane protein (UPF0127 family)